MVDLLWDQLVGQYTRRMDAMRQTNSLSIHPAVQK